MRILYCPSPSTCKASSRRLAGGTRKEFKSYSNRVRYPTSTACSANLCESRGSLPGKLRLKILAVSSHSNVLIILLILLTSRVIKVKHSYDRPLNLFRHQRNVNEVVVGGRRPEKTARRCALLQVAEPGHATLTGPLDQSAVAQGAHRASPWHHSQRLPKLQSELPWSHKVL